MQLTQALNNLVDFCYPGVCACCNAVARGSAVLCDTCDSELRKLENEPACEQCAMPLPVGASCGHCKERGLPPFHRIIRLGTHHDPIRALILQMKYHKRWPIAEFLADRLREQERVKRLLATTEVLVPMPLHPWRQIRRGYNQADVIARRLAKRPIRFVSCLARTRNTESQTHLDSIAKRVENVKDAFVLLDPRRIHGRHVLLVDDVMTSGATLRAAARALRTAKPASISAIVIAIADPKRRDFEVV